MRRARLYRGVPRKAVVVRVNERLVEIEHESLSLDQAETMS